MAFVVHLACYLRAQARSSGNLRFILIDWQIYSDELRQSSGRSSRSTLLENGKTFILIDFYLSSGRSLPINDLRFHCQSWSSSRSICNLRFILIDCYSESSGRPGGRSSGRSTDRFPSRKWQFEIHTNTLRTQTDSYSESSGETRWQIYPSRKSSGSNLRFILIDFYSESSGRSSGRSIPQESWQFEIHTDRFLLWELRQTR